MYIYCTKHMHVNEHTERKTERETENASEKMAWSLNTLGGYITLLLSSRLWPHLLVIATFSPAPAGIIRTLSSCQWVSLQDPQPPLHTVLAMWGAFQCSEPETMASHRKYQLSYYFQTHLFYLEHWTWLSVNAGTIKCPNGLLPVTTTHTNQKVPIYCVY